MKKGGLKQKPKITPLKTNMEPPNLKNEWGFYLYIDLVKGSNKNVPMFRFQQFVVGVWLLMGLFKVWMLKAWNPQGMKMMLTIGTRMYTLPKFDIT